MHSKTPMIVGISQAAATLGVSVSTLRRWEATGERTAEHTAGGHRRYDLAQLRPELFHASDKSKRKTIAYVPGYGLMTRSRTWNGRSKFWSFTAPAKAGASMW